MKKTIGVLIAIFIVAFIAILVLRIWGITIVSWQNVLKSSATLALLGIATVSLIIIYYFFFRKRTGDYQQNAGNRAHPKK